MPFQRRIPALAAAAAAFLASGPAIADPHAGCAGDEACKDDYVDPVSLLQTVHSERRAQGAGSGAAPQRSGGAGFRDLALVHVPWNFGHTVEKVGLFGTGVDPAKFMAMMSMVQPQETLFGQPGSPLTLQQRKDFVNLMMMKGGEQWGMFFPELSLTSPHTGCPNYLTPQRYWPKDLQHRYFGNRTIFGLLRDPYERLVAIFRGDISATYGGNYPGYIDKCDVNGAVKLMMEKYQNTTDRFAHGCVFLPQSNYFEGNGDYDITLPVDNRLFPSSMNDVFKKHGYSDMLIETNDILHVTKCAEVWGADLHADTRALVRKVYERDFKLLCKYFGYCDPDANACLKQVPNMCPQKVLG